MPCTRGNMWATERRQNAIGPPVMRHDCMIHHLYHVHACHSEVPEQTKSTSNRKGFDYLLTSDGVLGLGTGGRSSKGIDFRVTRVGSPATKESRNHLGRQHKIGY